MLNFDIKKTAVLQAVKIDRSPLFLFSAALAQLFLLLLIVSLAMILFVAAGDLPSRPVVKSIVLTLSLWLMFWELDVFKELKIKKPTANIKLADALDNPEYNLAGFLNVPAADIFDDAEKFCRRRKIMQNSSALFYSATKQSKDVRLILFRLGIDAGKLQHDLKNYLEKMQRSDNSQTMADDLQNTLAQSFAFAKDCGHNSVGEKELLCGLAKCDDFFKKVLIDCDLKEEDVRNLVIWLDAAENALLKSKQFWAKENLASAGSLGKDWASGYTVTLDQYGIDWRSIVSKWTFKEIVGHKKEIEQVEVILARSNLANALIVGEQGTGRKSIVQAIAQKCYLATSLPELNSKRVVELDLVTLVARIQDAEKLEAVLDQIFSEAIAAGNVIMVIDELQNFVGQKANKPGQVDISGILAKYLAMPNFQFIGITSFDGLHKAIEQNSSFAEFFRKVEVVEVTEAETIQILQSAALEHERKNKILIIYPALRETVNLTARYMPSLPFPKKALDVLDESVVMLQTLKEKILTPVHVAKVISQKTDIPVGKMDVKEKQVLLNLETLIHQRIVNQAEAVKEISIAMRRARAGIGSKKRPMGSFLFLGPTGVGKTETSKALAQIYFGSEDKMIRLDMSEYQAIADIPRLIGAVSPVEMQGMLTTPVRESPFSLVLLDEIEKAHPNILNLFLQVFDEGHITDGQGRKVMFTNTIIICTSNAGADIIFKEVESGQPVEKQQLLDSLISNGTFKPELINRFDAAVIFHPLTKENLMDIAQLTLQGIQKSLKEKEINFEITEALKEKIVDMSYKPEFGAREMRRVVQDNIENAIASAMLSETIKKADTFEINPENFELVVITQGRKTQA